MRIAKLFIRGLREPLDITEEQGHKANQIKKGEGQFATLTDKDTISIGDVWTGEKGDLRYVKFESIASDVEETSYSSKEMFDFEREIEHYCMKEGDSEYNEFINVLTKEIMDISSKLFWNNTTKDMMIEVRKDIDIFIDFDNWDKKGVDEQKDNEKDEDYEKRVKIAYDKAHVISLTKELEENKDKVREGAKKIVMTRMVGSLSKQGEYKYLVDKEAIRMVGDGFVVIKDHDGSIPFDGLSHKLNKYSEWKDRREYATSKGMEEYEEMSKSLTNNMDF